MIVSEVVTRVQRQFGDEASVQVEESDIIRWINDGLREIATQNDIGQTTSLLAGSIGVSNYSVPDNMMSMRTLYWNKARMEFMAKSEYDQYINATDPTETATGDPLIWTKWAGQFIVYPKPDSVKDFRLEYLSKPGEVFAGGDNLPIPSEYYNRVVEYCLQQAYQTDEDWDAASQMGSQFADGLTRLQNKGEEADSVEYYPTITVLPDDSGYC